MKLPRFEYACPETLDDAIRLLSSSNGEAKIIAGGQSLLPVLAFRLGSPTLIVDIRKLPGLDEIKVETNAVYLGAKVRWRDIEEDCRLVRAHPLLKAAVAHVAHYQIRNRGTVGGSLAHADPAAELPGIAATCDAEIMIVGPSGPRTVKADDFFVGPLSTVLASDEVLTGLRLPSWPAGRRWAFEEFSRRRGDFAIVGIALYYDQDSQGRASNVHIGVIGAGSRPQRLRNVEGLLDGQMIDKRAIAMASNAAAAAVFPPDDLHASAAYRRALVATLVERTLVRATA